MARAEAGVLRDRTPSDTGFQTSDSEIPEPPTPKAVARPYVASMKAERTDASRRVFTEFLLDHSPDPVVVLDSAGFVLERNRAARDDRFRGVFEYLEARPRDDHVLGFFDEVQRRGRARLELPGPAAPSFVLEGFAVGEWIVIVVRDQSERRALEEELRQLRRIESLGLVTASVIHDFNNLMTPMLALSSTLASELRASSRSLEIVADIESIANRTASLFRDIVTVTKPRRRGPEALDLGSVISELRPLLERVAGERVELVLDVKDDARVAVDRSRLEHALLNLVANARQAMPEGGSVTISASRSAGEGSNGSRRTVSLVVTDTGVGMNDYVRAHACDDFFTTRGSAGGTGLGLASVKRFVDESGGHLVLESEPGRGTTVTLCLPEADRPSKPAR